MSNPAAKALERKEHRQQVIPDKRRAVYEAALSGQIKELPERFATGDRANELED